jgi:hypothetical protein
MRYDLIASLLQTEGFGVPGTDIFIHRMDAETDAGILIRGPLDGIPVDNNLPDYYRGSLQIIVRNPDQQTGDALALRLQSSITMGRRLFTNPDGSLAMDVKQIYLAKLPIVYLRSVGRSIEWSLNFKTFYCLPN